MRMYRYLFFRIYRWGLRVHGPEDVPEFNAILGLSVLAVMNVLNILMAAELASGRGRPIEISKFITIVVGTAFLLLHFVYLVRGGRVEQICKEFEDQPPTTTATFFTWAYPLASFVFFFALPMFRQ